MGLFSSKRTSKNLLQCGCDEQAPNNERFQNWRNLSAQRKAMSKGITQLLRRKVSQKLHESYMEFQA